MAFERQLWVHFSSNSDVKVQGVDSHRQQRERTSLFITKHPFPLSSNVKDSCPCCLRRLILSCVIASDANQIESGAPGNSVRLSTFLREVINASGRIIPCGDISYGRNKPDSLQFWLNYEWEENRAWVFAEFPNSLTTLQAGGAGSSETQQLSLPGRRPRAGKANVRRDGGNASGSGPGRGSVWRPRASAAGRPTPDCGAGTRWPCSLGGVSSVSPSQTATWCAFQGTRSVSRGHSSVSSGTRCRPEPGPPVGVLRPRSGLAVKQRQPWRNGTAKVFLSSVGNTCKQLKPHLHCLYFPSSSEGFSLTNIRQGCICKSHSGKTD